MACRSVAGVPPKLAVIFASSWHDPAALLRGVRSELGAVPIIGGTTAGELTPEGVLTHSCVVALLAGEQLSAGVGLGTDLTGNARAAGQRAAYTAAEPLKGQPRVGCLTVIDGLCGAQAIDAVRGMQEVLGTGALIGGWLSGDDLRFARPVQFANQQHATGSIAAALLAGNVKLSFGTAHGFAPISKPRRITKAQEHRLLELDGAPAAAVYEEYFGAAGIQQLKGDGQSLRRSQLAYPLGIRVEAGLPAGHSGEPRWLLRTVTAFHPDGSLECTGEMAEGAWLQLMIGNRELALDAARRAVQDAIQPMGRIACVLVFDSYARRLLLGPRHAAEELAAIRHAAGGAPIAGGYGYGELATSSGHVSLQTGSVLVAAVGS